MIVLNDNEMSIDENVGGMSRYLNKIRVGQVYNGVKSGVEKGLLNIPGIGEGFAKVVKRGKDSIKELLVPGMFLKIWELPILDRLTVTISGRWWIRSNRQLS